MSQSPFLSLSARGNDRQPRGLKKDNTEIQDSVLTRSGKPDLVELAVLKTETTQPKAVNKISPGQAVRIELIRRGWKTAGLARRIGYGSGSLSNILSGNIVRPAAQCRIEDVLEMPFWSTPEEFAARQQNKNPGKKL